MTIGDWFLTIELLVVVIGTIVVVLINRRSDK